MRRSQLRIGEALFDEREAPMGEALTDNSDHGLRERHHFPCSRDRGLRRREDGVHHAGPVSRFQRPWFLRTRRSSQPSETTVFVAKTIVSLAEKIVFAAKKLFFDCKEHVLRHKEHVLRHKEHCLCRYVNVLRRYVNVLRRKDNGLCLPRNVENTGVSRKQPILTMFFAAM